MGKNVGDDLAEGKPTLPLIHSISYSSKADQTTLIDAIENGNRDNLEAVLSIIKSTGSLDYTSQAAIEQSRLAKLCLTELPESEAKTALMTIADFSVNRVF